MSLHRLKRTTGAMALVVFLVATALVAPAAVLADSHCSISLMRLDMPVCLSPSGTGYRLFFIGDKGVQEGPTIPGVAESAEAHPAGSGNVVLFAGMNPMADAPVGTPILISYLSDLALIHVHTGVWDTHLDAFKPIIYVVDGDSKISEWDADVMPTLPAATDADMEMADADMDMADADMDMADADMEMADADMDMADADMEMADADMEMAPMTVDPDHPARGDIAVVSMVGSAPVDVDAVGDELVFYMISSSGVFPGPRLPSVYELAKKYPEGSGNIVLYTGTNSLEGASSAAPVVISYLSDDAFLHVHTFTWDRHAKSFKSFVFVIDGSDGLVIWEK